MNIKKYRDKYAHFTIRQDTGYLTTHLAQLDNILNGGLPKGKIIEIFGHEGSGKSTLLTYLLSKYTNNKNKFVVLFDTEGSIYSFEHLKNLGINCDNIILLSISEGDKIFDILEELIMDDKCIMIGVDSIACLITQEEINGQDTIGAHARMLSKRMKLLINKINDYKSSTVIIFTNQIRSKINDAWKGEFTTTTTGGKAMKYYASVRIKMERIEYIKTIAEQKIGFNSMLKIEKSRISSPQQTCTIPFLYSRGVAQEIYYLEQAIKLNIITKSAGWYKINSELEQVTSLLEKHKIVKTKFQGKHELITECISNKDFLHFVHSMLNIKNK